jgi:septal ring factor EnvC (AmiA/AmiB activator)
MKKYNLITILCTRPGFRRFGHAWGTVTMVEVVAGKERTLSLDSPAKVAITTEDFAALKKMLAYRSEPGVANHCPLSFEDPRDSQIAVADLEAEKHKLQREIVDLRQQKTLMANMVQELEAERAAINTEREAMERKCAEYEARAQEAERAAARFQAEYEKTRTAIEAMNAPAQAKEPKAK